MAIYMRQGDSTTLAQGWGKWEVNLGATLDGGAATDDSFEFKPELTTEPKVLDDVVIYNGFEIVNTTSLDGTDGFVGGVYVACGDVDGAVRMPTSYSYDQYSYDLG